MSKYSRPVFSRPRTKVYDTNYNIGESYYKSALDGIDRKYGRMGPRGPVDFFGFPPAGPPPMARFERSPEPASLRPPMRGGDMNDEYFEDRRRQTSALLGEFDAAFEGRMRNGLPKERTPVRGIRALEDEIEEDMAASMRKLKAVKFARSMADEFEEDSRRESRLRSKMDFSDKVMDSVGLTGKARAALEEEGAIGRRRFLRITSDPGEADELTKWTALKPTIPRKYLLEEDDDVTVSTTGAAARARKSRARLDDLESEMQALSERSAAREKRVRDLKALVQENEANAMDNLHTTVRVQSAIQSEKRVNF